MASERAAQPRTVQVNILSPRSWDVVQCLKTTKTLVQNSREAIMQSDRLMLWWSDFGPHPHEVRIETSKGVAQRLVPENEL